MAENCDEDVTRIVMMGGGRAMDATTSVSVSRHKVTLIRLGIEFRDDEDDQWGDDGGAWAYMAPDEARAVAQALLAALHAPGSAVQGSN